MTIPSTKKQVEAVASYLDSEETEGKPLVEVAEFVVTSYHSLLKSEIKRPILEPHVGMAFKHPSLSGVWHIAWGEGTKLWVVSGNSRFGWFADTGDMFWEYAEESSAKSGAPGNNPDWSVGDEVTQHQREFRFEVIATGDKCVLLRSLDHGRLTVDSNDNMKQYYRREMKTKELEW